jgi:hypothetical protein
LWNFLIPPNECGGNYLIYSHGCFFHDVFQFTIYIFTINSPLSGTYGKWGLLIAWICRVHEKIHTETQHKLKTTCFHHSSFMGIILGNTVDWWVKAFRHVYCNMITNWTNLYCKGTCVREDDGWHC